MKTILFSRHAKSNWNQVGISYFERPLNDRGFIDAPIMAEYLKQCGYSLHQIISSNAVRALQTAHEYKKYLLAEKEILQVDALYLASLDDIIKVVSHLSDNLSAVMIVGHNPGMSEIVNYYSQDEIDDMPTCSVAVLTFSENNWKKLQPKSADLLAFEHPRSLLK